MSNIQKVPVDSVRDCAKAMRYHSTLRILAAFIYSY